MRKWIARILLAGALLQVLSVIVVTIFLLFFMPPDLMVYGNTLEPQRQFEVMTGLPPTPDVSEIEGIGGGWQGYDFWLRFRCEPGTFERIIERGYEPVSVERLDQVEDRLDFQSRSDGFDPDHFTPEWAPGAVRSQRCYENRNLRNEWTERGETYIVYDPISGWAHLYSSGT